MDFSGAKSTFIHITSGPELTVRQTNELIKGMTEFMGPDANVIFGARIDNDYKGEIKIMSIVNGVEFANPYLSVQAKEPTQCLHEIPIVA